MIKTIYVLCGESDRGRVEPVASALAREGCAISFPGPEAPAEERQAALEESGLCVVFLSRRAVGDHGCRQGINQAALSGKPFLVIMLEWAQLPPSMEAQLAGGRTLLYPKDAPEALLERLRALKELEGFWPEIPQPGKEAGPLALEGCGRRTPLREGCLRLGAKAGRCDIVIPDNSGVSRVHAEIRTEGGISRVQDLGSTNGTFLNGRLLEPGRPVLLRAGDSLRLGGEGFTIIGI